MTIIEITKEMELMGDPLTSQDLETYNSVLNYYLNRLGKDIYQVSFDNISDNAKELSLRLSNTENIDKQLLNKTRLKLSLAIPLLKAKGKDELAKKLEKNLKDILDWLNKHVELSEYHPHMDHQPNEKNDPLGLILRGNFNPEIKELAKKIVSSQKATRPKDRELLSISGDIAIAIKGYQDNPESAPDQFEAENELILRSVQKMMEERQQNKLSWERSVGLSNAKANAEQEHKNHLSKKLRLAADLFLKSVEGY